MDVGDGAVGPPLRRAYPSLARCLCAAIARRLYGAASLLEMWHARKPWVTRLLIPVAIMWVWWSVMADPNAAALQPVTTLDAAACASLLSLREAEGGSAGLAAAGGAARTDGARSLASALALAAGESKRLLLAESNSGYAALSTNWVRHVQTLRPPLPNYIVVALDKAEGRRLATGGVNSYFDPSGCVGREEPRARHAAVDAGESRRHRAPHPPPPAAHSHPAPRTARRTAHPRPPPSRPSPSTSGGSSLRRLTRGSTSPSRTSTP